MLLWNGWYAAGPLASSDCQHAASLAAGCLPVQIAGGQRYRPPAVDVNAPDLFIPLMGLWSYALLSCIVLAFKHTFKPELMSSTVSGSWQARVCSEFKRPC